MEFIAIAFHLYIYTYKCAFSVLGRCTGVSAKMHEMLKPIKRDNHQIFISVIVQFWIDFVGIAFRFNTVEL